MNSIDVSGVKQLTDNIYITHLLYLQWSIISRLVTKIFPTCEAKRIPFRELLATKTIVRMRIIVTKQNKTITITVTSDLLTSVDNLKLWLHTQFQLGLGLVYQHCRMT